MKNHHQKGSATIIAFIVLLLTLGGAAWYFKNFPLEKLSAVEPIAQPPVAEPQKQLTIAPLSPITEDGVVVGNDGVCTIANGCPSDKCVQQSYCTGGGEGTGCALGGSSCLYKDSVLKGNYHEISFDKAVECTKTYVTANKSAHLKYKYLDFSSASNGGDATSVRTGDSLCGNNYCWSVFYSTKQIPSNNSSYQVSFDVDAQTCEVHLNDPESLEKF